MKKAQREIDNEIYRWTDDYSEERPSERHEKWNSKWIDWWVNEVVEREEGGETNY